MTTTFTEHFRFGIPDFNSEPWHDQFYDMVQHIDDVLYDALFLAGATTWANNASYPVGHVVISPEDGSVWITAVAHTSAASPTTFSADRAAHPGYWTNTDGGPSTPLNPLTDGVTVTLDASLGNMFTLNAGGDHTIAAPINPPGSGKSQKLIIRHFASGGSRTLTLATGTAGSFRFGSTIIGISTTLAGKSDYIGCLWHVTDARWDVVAYSKGY